MEPKNELQRNAVNTERRKELDSYQRAMDRGWLDSRMADGGMSRCLATIQREAKMEKDFRERTDHAALVNTRAEEETALGREVAQIEQDEMNLVQRRQFLERDPELRELTKKLEAGYVCRDLQLQIQQNEYQRCQEKADELRAMGDLRHSLSNDKEYEEKMEASRHDTAQQYGLALKQQLGNQQRQRQSHFEDQLIERKMMDDVMKTISDEDQRELQHKRDQTNLMRDQMHTEQAARAAWKDKQKTVAVEEATKIEEQLKAMDDRTEAVIAERERKMHVKEDLNDIVCSKIMAAQEHDEAAKQSRADVITLLQEQEYLEKSYNDDVTAKDKLEKDKRDMNQALEAQMASKRDKIGEEMKLDAQLKRENDAQYAVDDERNRQKALTVKQRNHQYGEDLKQQIKENAERKKKEKEEEERREKELWSSEGSWRREVLKERERIVKEHAPSVVGFLQNGVLGAGDLNGDRKEEQSAGKGRPRRFAKCNPQCAILRKY